VIFPPWKIPKEPLKAAVVNLTNREKGEGVSAHDRSHHADFFSYRRAGVCMGGNSGYAVNFISALLEAKKFNHVRPEEE
jgi:hypothetical protein